MEYSMPILITLTTLLVQIIKEFNVPKNLLPVISIFVGVGFSCFTALDGSPLNILILNGIVIGLSGAGLFDVAKVSVKGTIDKLNGKENKK